MKTKVKTKMKIKRSALVKMYETGVQMVIV